MKADPEQIERIQAEGWSLTEIALRAGVDRSTVVRWSRLDLAPMPYNTAAQLVLQADGLAVPPNLDALTALCARRAHRRAHA